MVAANQIFPRISLPEAARQLGKSVEFIKALHAAGEIVMSDERKPGAKIPRWMIDPQEIARWLQSRLRIVAPAPARATVAVVKLEGNGVLDRMRARKRARQAASRA